VGDIVETTATRHGYDLVAREYRAQVAGELVGKPLDRALLDMVVELAEGELIGDIGCGPGHVASYLAGRGAAVVGLDLSTAMCSIGSQASSLPFCVADMTALPIRSHRLGAIVSLYAVIHLDASGRAAAYFEFARALRPGGHALIAFHTCDADTASGEVKTLTDWWGHEVVLKFRFLEPMAEIDALASAGLVLVARLDRAPYEGIEHPSSRSYLLVRRLPIQTDGSTG
jgi:SAM-dependent methyltransferase